MKLFGAINDGYRFIYSTQKENVEDWLSIYPNNFCILKVFELEVEENKSFYENNDLFINLNFNKTHIPQNDYIIVPQEKLCIVFSNELAMVTPINYRFSTQEYYEISLNEIEYAILNASRNYLMRKKEF